VGQAAARTAGECALLQGIEPPDAGIKAPASRPVAGPASVAERTLRIGIVASELPPGHGGMQEHARSLISCLSANHEIQLFTGAGSPTEPASRNVSRHPVLHWHMTRDLAVLEGVRVDAWLTLNAGLASYSMGLRAPTFAYVHGNDFLRPWMPYPERRTRLAGVIGGEGVVERWRRRQIADGLQAARGIFSNSAFSRDLCAKLYGVPEERFSVIPPGIAPEFFQIGDPQPDPALRLITVSRLSAQSQRKNIDSVLRAVAMLRDDMAIRYTVIGDGDDLPRLRALADALGIADLVSFPGGIDQQALVEAFARHDAFILAVQPRQGDVEGFGMVFAQAGASGLPSIATAAGGIPEVVEEGQGGLLLDDVSPAGVAAGLRRFQGLRHSFDRAAIRSRAGRFSAEVCSLTMAGAIARML